ncbi:autotransporter assembly complex protein TamA [Erythrobacter litoralis]|uniref:Bacterial surface antigen (D15) domain-containing protein n=1 Tax=Erythrobacter litoralis (strain HTCC2594) TaxID=314225 RepID=Q2ND21_ERYLH|nr:BamA/TamA family outer membrane protein [Erythrobacter litoralis]ABC62420.1 hypothetical protein ELI_01640 [Erythrobacter litoralis HTCC2594]
MAGSASPATSRTGWCAAPPINARQRALAGPRSSARQASLIAGSLHWAAILALALPSQLAAQQSQQQRLEDLIPDSAVEDPDSWAAQGVEARPEDAVDEVADADIDTDTPLAELPDMAIEWPDEIELAEAPEVEPDESLEFAEATFGDEDFLPDAQVVEITDSLVLAFPAQDEGFTVRNEFVERFDALSNIKAFDDGETNVAQLAARAAADEELLNNLLRNYGFYDGLVVRTLGEIQEADEIPAVRFDIVPGPRYRFGVIDLGSLVTAPDANELRAAFEIESGDPLDNDRIIAEQLDLDIALGETGYPFAEIAAPSLLIDHDRSEGDLTLPVEPNGKYAFGQVISDRPEFLSSRHLQRIARFEAGDVYQRSLQLDLRRAITATGLVSRVSIDVQEVQPPADGDVGVVDLNVAMTPAPLRTIAGAVGYGSEEGFRVQASWEHRNLFPPEGSLRVRGILGTREQLAGVTFRKNNFRKRDQILTLDAYASDLETDAVDARTIALRGTFERVSNLLFQKDFSWLVGAEVLATDERNVVRAAQTPNPLPRETFFIGSIFGEATIDDTDSLLDPTKGFRLRGFAAPEVSRTQGSQYFYLRAQVDGSIYQRVTDNVVLAGRLTAATITGAPRFAIAPSRRLYAGGGGSVRGYGFQAIGPVDQFDIPLGGRSLVEGSVEARVQTGFMDGAVSVVPFLDFGSVSTSSIPDFETVKFGAGLGLRYATGFGPIRFDVGVPLNPGPNDSSVAVYVSLGQAF